MLFLYAVARPIYLNTFADANVTAADTSTCDDIDKCRTIADILWNCYSVVLLCTWVAVHPDVPSVKDHLTVVLMKYGIIVFMAIVAPELIILWALRQWVSCRKIAQKYKEYGWGKSHAFLVLMGGLALYEGDQFVCHLWDREKFNDYIDPENRHYHHSNDPDGEEMRIAIGISNGWTWSKIKANNLSHDVKASQFIFDNYSCLLEFLLDKGYIQISEDEIKDKGNADALTKVIALFQTLWFILQCCARAVQGLDVTAIEIVTFAFAVLNFVTYFLWWNKPLRMRRPVRVYWQLHPPTRKEKSALFARCKKGIDAAARYIADDYASIIQREAFFRFIKWPIFAPIYPVAALSTRFRDLGTGCESDDCRYLFSSRLERDTPGIYIASYIIAVIFAAIHCIPWFFPFPTPIEQSLWRISAIAATSAPIVLGLLHLSGKHILVPMIQSATREPLPTMRKMLILGLQIIGPVWIVLISSLFIVYVAARLALIVLALTALRALPRDGYEAVQWNMFLPHIG
ncbi:hypothetical protein WG66_014579 [Moniliophthora roreri]|nr:hypothetical protein WG66_014579 [Moniliophthora roreri]